MNWDKLIWGVGMMGFFCFAVFNIWHANLVVALAAWGCGLGSLANLKLEDVDAT